jgi:molybdopterin-guanine dinucleotide biosynthesis protein B
MSTSALIGFYGKSNSGKTTLIIKIIEQLVKERYTVATIKNTDKNVKIDTEGKDTWKHQHAGAKLVALSSPYKTDLMINKRMDVNKIVDIIFACEPVDIVLVEGARNPNIPKIKIGNGEKRDNTIMQYQDDFEEVMKIIKKEIDKKKRKQKIKIEVNGKEIVLSEFPADIITGTLVGMLSSLKGIDQINEVAIHLKISR